jgi:ribonuclease ZC3H12
MCTNNVLTANAEIMDELEAQGNLIYTPSRFVDRRLIAPYDDKFILESAFYYKAIIVSNDNYNDLKSNEDWKTLIESR